MQVASYRTPDGDQAVVDYADGVFTVGGSPTPVAEVLKWDSWGSLEWVSPQWQEWAGAQAAPQVPTALAVGPSLFSRLPVWVKVLFVLCWPVSIPYAVAQVWRRTRWPTVAKAIATGAAAMGMLFLALASGVFGAASTAPTTAPGPTASVAPAASRPATSAAVVATEPPPAIKAVSATVARHIDGDTAEFTLADGRTEKVRFIGIDTPESTIEVEAYGEEASAYTAKALPVGTQVLLEEDVEQRDKYGRLLAYVWLSMPTEVADAEIRAKMFNAKLALDGYAQQMTIQPNSQYAEYFTTYVAEARDAERGLWSPVVVAAPAAKPAPAPAAPSGPSYIGNRNTKKFHYADCSSVGQMNESNKVSLSSRQAAINAGYVPCKRCNP